MRTKQTDRGRRARLILALAAAVLAAGAAAPAPAAEKESVALTVYNQNFALVKDVRVLELGRGQSEVRIDDVAASIDPTSVHFGALDHPGAVAVLEQNYQYDLADADRILDRYLSHPVTVVLKEGDTREGVLLSFSGSGLVLDAGSDGAVIVNRAEVRDIRLGEIPGGLVVKPTLVWTLASDRQGKERCELSYLTDNVTWHAEYVAVVNQKDDGLDMDGWVSLDNQSGATYENAKLKLVAGDVHRVQPPQVLYKGGREMDMAMPMAAAPQFEERGFFEYHIYTLSRPATVADRETKQLSLFPSARASAKKVFTYDGARDPKKVEVRIEFDNAKDNGLGMALPAGKVRVYKEDQDGALEFAGEDQIDHTPRDEKVRLYLGNAFDVVGERKRTEYTKVSQTVQEEAFEIEIRNHKSERIEVVVVEHLAGDWRILDKSQEFTKKDSQTVEFPVVVDADGTATVTYRVRTTW
jgi:hypothetical protein